MRKKPMKRICMSRMGLLLFMHYLDMHTVAIYAPRLTFKHFRENVVSRFFFFRKLKNIVLRPNKTKQVYAYIKWILECKKAHSTTYMSRLTHINIRYALNRILHNLISFKA